VSKAAKNTAISQLIFHLLPG